MNPARFLLFSGTLALFHIATDIALFYLAKSFVRKRQWNPLFYKIIAYISPIMLLLFVYTQWQKQVDGIPTAFTNISMVLLTIWHIPKYILLLIGSTALILLYSGKLMKFIIQQIHRFTAKDEVKQQLPDTITQPDGRRLFLKTATLAAVSAPYIAVGRGIYTAFLDIDVRYVPLPIKNLPSAWQGLTIAQISDVHAGSFFSKIPIRSFCEETLALKPDIITITGDWVNFRPSELPMIFPEFSRLKAPLGVFGSLGNHDHYMTDEDHRMLQQTIRNNGIRLLVNEHTTLTSGGDSLYIAGIDNTGSRQRFGDVGKALQGVHSESPVILLAHDPTVWDKEIRGQQPVDVMLSGHTHGGQFVVDVMGEQLSPARAVYKQWAGFYDDSKTGQVLYVNRGMGTTGIPMRLGIPPELTLFTLQRA